MSWVVESVSLFGMLRGEVDGTEEGSVWGVER